MRISLPTSTWDCLGQSTTIATVIGFIAAALGSSARGAGITSAVSFAITLGIFYLLRKSPETGERLRSSRIAPSIFVAVILSALLAGALFRQHEIDSQKVSDLGEISDTLRWRLNLCFKHENCVVEALSELPNKIESTSDDPSEQLFADQALGEIVRTSAVAKDLLTRSYGVYPDRFLGTGESLPLKNKDFTAERIPEYLVPNYPDDHPNVLTWRLSPDDPLLTGTLDELLKHEPVNQPPDLARTRKLISDQLKDPMVPSLVRFAMVPDLERGSQTHKYSGCFALPNRLRAFFSNLDYMMKNTASVKAASELAGAKFVAGKGKEIQYLYVFMFAPLNSDECRDPTWRNLLIHLKEPSACSPGVKNSP